LRAVGPRPRAGGPRPHGPPRRPWHRPRGPPLMPTPLIAEMSAGDLAAVIVTICSIVAVVAVLFALQRTLATLRQVRAAMDALHERSLPVVDELADTVEAVNVELERVDRLVGSAESISQTVD